jgi:hypothetical protein
MIFHCLIITYKESKNKKENCLEKINLCQFVRKVQFKGRKISLHKIIKEEIEVGTGGFEPPTP